MHVLTPPTSSQTKPDQTTPATQRNTTHPHAHGHRPLHLPHGRPAGGLLQVQRARRREHAVGVGEHVAQHLQLEEEVGELAPLDLEAGLEVRLPQEHPQERRHLWWVGVWVVVCAVGG